MALAGVTTPSIPLDKLIALGESLATVTSGELQSTALPTDSSSIAAPPAEPQSIRAAEPSATAVPTEPHHAAAPESSSTAPTFRPSVPLDKLLALIEALSTEVLPEPQSVSAAPEVPEVPEVPAAQSLEPIATDLTSVANLTTNLIDIHPEWTAEEDTKLLELKGKSVSWKQITTEMGNKKGIRERYKELMKYKKPTEAKGKDTLSNPEAQGKDAVSNPEAQTSLPPEKTSTKSSKKEKVRAAAPKRQVVEESRETAITDTVSEETDASSAIDIFPDSRRETATSHAKYADKKEWGRPTILLEDGGKMDLSEVDDVAYFIFKANNDFLVGLPVQTPRLLRREDVEGDCFPFLGCCRTPCGS